MDWSTELGTIMSARVLFLFAGGTALRPEVKLVRLVRLERLARLERFERFPRLARLDRFFRSRPWN